MRMAWISAGVKDWFLLSGLGRPTRHLRYQIIFINQLAFEVIRIF